MVGIPVGSRGRVRGVNFVADMFLERNGAFPSFGRDGLRPTAIWKGGTEDSSGRLGDEGNR